MPRKEFTDEPDFSPGVWEAFCPNEFPQVAIIDIKRDKDGLLVGRCRRPVRTMVNGKEKLKKDEWMYLGFFLSCTWRKIN